MKERNNYLINKSLKKYLFASIASLAIININGLIDSVLMGRLIGPQAVSAIQNVVPVTSVLSGLCLLLSAGASVIVAKALGRRDMDEASSSMTVSVISLLGLGIMISLLSLFFAPKLSDMLCMDASLYDNTFKYLSVLLGGAFLLLLLEGTGALVEVAGYPKIVSVAMLCSALGNLISDILYVKVFSMGIGGAALATLTGTSLGVAVLFWFLFRKRKELGLRPCFRGFGHMLGQNAKLGIPTMLSSFALTLMIFMCNYFVQSAHGETGLFVMSIGYNVMLIGQMVSNGVEGAILGVGGMLAGQRDYDGLRRLFKKGLTVSLGFAAFCNTLVWFLAGPLARLFGAKEAAMIELTEKGLPMISITIFALCSVLPMVIIYQLNEHPFLSVFSALSLLFTLGVGFVLAKYVFGNIWLTFPVGAGLSIGLVLLLSIPVRRKAGGTVGPVHLIPLRPEGVERLDLSMPCDRNQIGDVIREVRGFLSEQNSEERALGVVHCMEELLLNYTEHSGRPEKAYMDISLIRDPDGLTLFLKDDGVPFDPVHIEKGKLKTGLTIVKGFTHETDYTYSFGQNITIMKWGAEND